MRTKTIRRVLATFILVASLFVATRVADSGVHVGLLKKPPIVIEHGVAPVAAAPSAAVSAKALILPTQPASSKLAVLQTGIASWYPGEGAGARGDVLTAAHRRLPFGTLVKVINLANNRSAIVRINDRGPFTKGRIIDVNAAAARQLAMVRSGTSRVRLELVNAGSSESDL
ncbi:MAG: rare lipoprotein [Chthoniobacter sp.]|jgi:rare lipoprotein A|nr:rare lipoprotein [Chthoniobacter sp.]